MALTYQVIGAAADDDAFKQRVKGYLGIAGASVFSESVGTTNHANRLIWAEAVLADPSLWASRLSVLVAGQHVAGSASTLATLTDTNIQTAVDGLINYAASLVT